VNRLFSPRRKVKTEGAKGLREDEEMRRLRIISIIALALVSTFPVAVQGRYVAGARSLRASKLAGVVSDANNARIVGAMVKIENARFSRAVQSDDEGAFEIELPAGVYRLTVEMNGFKRFVLPSVRVRAGARASVSVQMEVKPPQTTLQIE
jgi:Carboxypeptidase regulatory-like domain